MAIHIARNDLERGHFKLWDHGINVGVINISKNKITHKARNRYFSFFLCFTFVESFLWYRLFEKIQRSM